jgi:membrane-bound lytic murein transglycosylase D
MINALYRLYSQLHLKTVLPLLLTSGLCSLATPTQAQVSIVNGVEMEMDLNSIDNNLTADPIETFINNNDNATSGAYANNQDDLWERVREGFAIPNIDSEYTAKYETWYASRPSYVKRMLERSQKYLFHIVEEVQKRNMPTEIALLPMIESAYNPQANSKSNAVGIWQFVPATGKDFGLKQSYWSDKRRDVTAATSAALTYLQKLHGMFGSWDLALAAYNAGEGTVSRAIERNRSRGLPTDYQDLDLPEETRNYVPKLQAIKNIVFKPENYGLTLVDIPNRPYFTRVLAPKQIDAKLAAKLAEISSDEFNALNPSYNSPVIVSNNEAHQLLLPVWAANNFKNNLNDYDKPLTSWKPYTAKRGERIDYIAEKFNISPERLREINHLSSSKKIASSRDLLVPNQSSNEANLILADFKTTHPQETYHEDRSSTSSYKVRTGDTVQAIAKKFKVSSKQILRDNHLKSSKLKVGQSLLIATSSASNTKSARTNSTKIKSTKTKSSKVKLTKNKSSKAKSVKVKASKKSTSSKKTKAKKS